MEIFIGLSICAAIAQLVISFVVLVIMIMEAHDSYLTKEEKSQLRFSTIGVITFPLAIIIWPILIVIGFFKFFRLAVSTIVKNWS